MEHMGLVCSRVGSTCQDAQIEDELMRTSAMLDKGLGLVERARGALEGGRQKCRTGFPLLSELIQSREEAGRRHGCWAPTHILSVVRDAKDVLIFVKKLGKGRDSNP